MLSELRTYVSLFLRTFVLFQIWYADRCLKRCIEHKTQQSQNVAREQNGMSHKPKAGKISTKVINIFLKIHNCIIIIAEMQNTYN
jgi:hypothetical protein